MELIAHALFAVLRWLWETLVESFLFELVWHTVLFNVGRAALLLCTLGRYPRGAALECHEDRIAAFGLLVVLAVGFAPLIHGSAPAPVPTMPLGD
ncbi:hypothetical protein ASG87_08310 [Frateuria sp. Soil773]|uniref:hypothetical protein n=1 Tax=Frateuria sp. Soil773 TaxID=1736407 RepID=UPI0006FADF06|nr:hypothetical protein [Frateuria sp. Soil773]KRE88575.1 hypothetical protein ASG87_08310 [Frateuria sp. Soil773]